MSSKNHPENEENTEIPEEDEVLHKAHSTSSSVSMKYFGDSIDFDRSSMKCFKEIELSSSSLFKHSLYFFPELDDPGIFEAFRYEPPLEIDNDVGRERYLRICKMLEVVPLKRVLMSLDQDLLDLRYYGLRPKELRAIFHVLEMNAYIKTLLLQDSWLNEDSVHLLSNMLTHNMTISVLNLKQCEIGPEGAAALNEGLQLTVSLKDLDLSFNSLGDHGIQNLKLAFRSNESIKKINLGHNNLTSASASMLQQFFASHEVVEEVNLEWNMLGNNESMKKITLGLKENSHIKVLNLSWNALESPEVAKMLSRFIKGSTTLEELDLSNNRFKSRPAMIMKSAITVSTSLKHVKLGSNPLTHEDAAALGNMLLFSPRLKSLDLENVYIHRTFLPELKKIENAGKIIIIGGILENYKIIGPDVRHVLLRRCHFLGLAPKRVKAKRDFGQIALTLPEKPLNKADFEEFIRKKKKGKMYDTDLLAEMRKAFAAEKRKVDTKQIASEYMKLYPETTLALKAKRKRKGRGRNKKLAASSTSVTATTIETEITDRTIPEETIEVKVVPSKTRSVKSSSSQPIVAKGSSHDKTSSHSATSGNVGEMKTEEEVQTNMPTDNNESIHQIVQQTSGNSLEKLDADEVLNDIKNEMKKEVEFLEMKEI